MITVVLLSAVNSFAQIRNQKTGSVKISGNCSMCKKTIEKAGNINNVVNVEWNKDTKIATVNYDSVKINQEEVLKRIALAGYDNEEFLAPNEAYAKLSDCCQYDRVLKTEEKAKNAAMPINNGHDKHNHGEMPAEKAAVGQSESPLKAVFFHYFSITDALVKTDTQKAAAKATALTTAIKAVKMDNLSNEEHNVWMKSMKDLTVNAERIAMAKDISRQRDAFASLSQNLYALLIVFKPDVPSYYQHCPMYNNGSYWLSTASTIKNPFYGAQMLTCGSTKETLK